MRSETAPIWVTFILAMGFFLLLAAVVALVTGKATLTKTRVYQRSEQPQAYWTMVAALALIGVPALVYGITHFGPGGGG